MIETSRALVKAALPKIEKDFHKFDRGRLFVVAGSYGMAGAAIMAGQAALRTGVGFLHFAVPASVYPLMAPALPEAVFTVYDEKDPKDVKEKLLSGVSKASAVLLGCGLGTLRETVCPLLFENCEKPLLVDADGLTRLSVGDFSGETVSRDLVLTPHAGEMGRLLGISSGEVEADRLGSLTEACRRYHGTVLLKGAETLIGNGESLYVNRTGTPGMARAGSGDTLSGIIGSLMAQGEDGLSAAYSGAWLHGRAGLLSEEIYGTRSMLPTDMSALLPTVMKEVER